MIKTIKFYFLILSSCFFFIIYLSTISNLNSTVFSSNIKKNYNLKHTKENQDIIINSNKHFNIDQKEFFFKVSKIINKYSLDDNISISFTDLNTDTYLSFNDSKDYLAASTSKVALALLVCKELANGTLNLTDTLVYESRDYEDGTGIMLYDAIGNIYTIDTLLKNMLVYSDNIATNMLYRFFGFPNAREKMSFIIDTNLDIKENTLNTSQLNDFLIYLYNKKEISYYNNIIMLLTKTIFHDRLDKYIDYNIVSHKIGNYYSNIHDCGIFLTENPYVLTVFTYGKDENSANKLISNISKDIFDLYNL